MNNYICISPYKEIPEGAMVQVDINVQVRITYNKHSYGANEFVLALHFEKVEG